MSNEELVKALKLLAFVHNDGAMTQAADRIDELEVSLQAVLDREAATTARYDAKLETLTEQLEAARADAKEAEAYAKNLREERDTLRLVIEANIEKHRSRAEAAEAKLAKAVEALGIIKDRQFYRMGPGITAQVIARATLAEIEGEKG